MHKYALLMLLPFLQGCFSKNSLKLLWQAPIATDSSPIVVDGIVYVDGKHAGHPEESYRVFALDAATGKEKWISEDSVVVVYGVSGGSVFFRNKSEHLVQLDAQTGEKRHESDDSDTPLLHWLVQGDVMFLINTSMEVIAVDNRQDKVLWRMALPFKRYDVTDLQMAGQYVIVNGNFSGDEKFGMIWALDAATGKEIWHYEVPPPHDYAPLTVLAHEPYILATNTSPLHLKTHVLDAHTGKELYPPIYAFDFRGCYEETAHASGGAFDLKTGKRMGEAAPWIAGSVIQNGIAWQRQIATVGGFFLRRTYDGDMRGSRDWTNVPPNSSIEGFDMQTGKSVAHTEVCKYTQFSVPVEAGGVLYHSSIAMMKEGKSGVWAYRLPKGK